MKQIILFLLLVPSISFCQNKTIYIDLENEKFIVENRKFYISKVIDEREGKSNLGLSQIGAFNKKVFTQFTKNFETTILGFISNSLTKKDGLQAIVMKVRKLTISELTNITTEIGRAELIVDFYAFNNDKELVKVFQIGSIKEGRGLDVTKKHELRIRQTIEYCLQKLNSSNWQENISAPLETQSEKPVQIPKNLNIGVYKSFQEFLNNSPSTTDGFYLKFKPRTNQNWIGSNSYKIKYSNSSNKIKNPWGFCDGENVFIFHQNNFFPIYITRDKYMFKGFALINQASITSSLILGGLIVGGLTSDAELKKAKNSPTIYSIGKYTGTLTKELTEKMGKVVNLYIGLIDKI